MLCCTTFITLHVRHNNNILFALTCSTFYCISTVTEDEIHNGISSISAPNDHCLCYIREVVDIRDNVQDVIACRYIDANPFNSTEVDDDAQQLLKQLKEEKLPAVLDQSNNVKRFAIPWVSGGVHLEKHNDYLLSLCHQVYTDVKKLIDKALAAKETKVTELHQEVLHHVSFCLSKCETFGGREDLLLQVHQFLASGKRMPLIIYGHSGSGKTTVMAKSALMAGEWMVKLCVTVVRFLGTSPASSSIREVLVSVCTQISTVYSLKIPNFSEMDSTQIIQYFCNQFFDSVQTAIGGDSHICIFLDSIDQLSPMDGAHSLNWLPKRLQPNVHIVISMLPDKHNCLETLRTMMPYDDCYIEVGALPLHTGLHIMESWLSKLNRTITSKQREVLSAVFTINPQPLYLRLLFHHTQQWHSFTDINQTRVAISTSEAIQQLFSDVEEQYGKVLVQKALGYITASKSGLTESELEDTLSLDNEVLNEVYQYWDPPDKGLLRIPALLWKRIRYEISDYLVEQHADGKTVFAWYHRQFVESAKAIYLGDEARRLSIHQSLSEYFEGIWSGKERKSITLIHRNLTLDNADRQVATQPLRFSEDVFNLRKLNELPYHMLLSRQLEKLKLLALCNFQWLHTKLSASGFQKVMHDFTLSLGDVDDADIATTSDALSLSASNLMSDASSLAGQLLGRLKLLAVLSKHIQALTDQAQHWASSLSGKHQLIPINSCLISPGGPLKTTLSAHSHVIHQLSLSKSHSLMVSSSKGSNCSIFNVWDVRSLPQYVQNLHTLRVCDSGNPCFCLRNELLFSASGQTITAWNCITGETVLRFCTSSKVTALTTAHNSQYLLLGLVVGSIVCYDRVSDSQFEIKSHNSSVNFIAAFKDRTNTVVTASSCGQLSTYNVNLHKILHTIQAHSSAVTCMNTASHSGKSYVLTGSDDKTAKVWTIGENNLYALHTLKGHTKTVKCITNAHLHTSVVATGSLDKTIRIWDAFHSGQCIQTLEGHLDGVWCIAAIPEGPRVVSGSKDDYLKVWDISTGECLHTLEGHSSWVSCVAMASANDVIISGSNDKNIKVWKLDSRRSPPTDRHFAQPECIVSTNSGLCVSGAPDAIKVWDLTSGRSLHTFSSPASCLSVTDDGRYLISGSKEPNICIWDLTSFSNVHTMSSQHGATTCLATLDTNTYLSAHSGGTLALRDFHTEKCTVLPGHTSSVKCIALSKDKGIAVSGSHDCTVRVWDLSNTKCITALTGHAKVVWCVAVSSDNAYIASGGDDSTVRIWNISNNNCLHCINHSDNVKCIVFSSDDKVVIAGSHSGQDQLRAWSTVTGECRTNYKGHTHAVMCMLVMDKQTIITGSRDGTVKVWDISPGKTLATFDLQSQVKHIALLTLAESGCMSLAATTKSGPIAILNYILASSSVK